jgi:CubicO group peptidase (beta-lactamase class C family)
MKKNIIIPLLVFLSFVTYISVGQSLSSHQIDSVVSSAMSVMPHAGIAVAVVKDGKVIHSKGYGIASVNTQNKVDDNTLFAIASNTKSFTAVALAILVEEGKLRWSDKVVDYVPEFTMYDPYVTANFNIQDLLTHRSGLGLGAGDLMIFPDGGDFTMEDIAKSFQYQKQVSQFRTKYDYDNLLYIIAGEIVARVSGMGWSEFVELYIMKPLEMNRSAALFQNLTDTSNIALPHSIKNGELLQLDTYSDPSGLFGAAAGIYASVNDMSKYLIMFLNECKYGDSLSNKIISEKNLAEIWKPHTNRWFNATPNPPYKSHFGAYGLGWGISDKNGFIVYEHTGGLPGMLSKMAVIPELNAGVIVLTNSDPGGYSYWSISQEIIDAFIGVEQKDWVDFMKSRIASRTATGDSVTNAVWNTVKKANAKRVDFDDYVGIYSDNWFGNVEISNDNGELLFRSIRSPKLTGRMYYYKANTFAIKWNYQDMESDAFAIFQLDEEGKAVGIKMKGISPNIDFSFDFHDLDFKR